jgi:hypothetical protein
MFTADTRKPRYLFSRMKSKRHLDAEASSHLHAVFVSPPFVGSILPGNTYTSERGCYVYRKKVCEEEMGSEKQRFQAL